MGEKKKSWHHGKAQTLHRLLWGWKIKMWNCDKTTPEPPNHKSHQSTSIRVQTHTHQYTQYTNDTFIEKHEVVKWLKKIQSITSFLDLRSDSNWSQFSVNDESTSAQAPFDWYSIIIITSWYLYTHIHGQVGEVVELFFPACTRAKGRKEC